ncbi:MAG TPA: cytochrome c-type biogenesis protein CcmH [Solirubrobacteraceae bacterium]|jgi:cytochrome c-type biogenesis protein CcmH|nr:cytochrome c-type biogenesis protein CcmH [Solirubrobacteraceae bacterium]
MRRRALVLLATAALATTGGTLTAATAHASNSAAPRASLPAIERQVMCVTCKIPLNVAQSPQADRERAFIQGLIDQGLDEAQIKRALVAQYGSSVLALPSAHGFGVLAYAVPLAAAAAIVALLVVLLPRWRTAGRARRERSEAPPALSTEDAARLEADMARFD